MSTAALLPTFLITKKSGLSISTYFHKNSLIVTCCTFGRFEIRTLTPSRLKNQTNDTLKLLGTIYITWNIFELNPLNILWSLFWINIINISVSSTLSCVHCSFNIKLFALVFHEKNYLIDASYNLRNLEFTTSALNRFF